MSVIKVNTIQNANGTTGITFAANGQMTLANTPLQLTGGQIKFPGTQIASGDANTLDDYEEGTWTPVIGAQTGSLTAYTSSGTYTKVGRTVYINGKFIVTTTGTASGYAQVGAYPFTPDSNFDTQGVAREGSSSGDIYFSLLTTGGPGFIIGISGNGGINWTANRSYFWNFSYNI
jgi:hypothetical protein